MAISKKQKKKKFLRRYGEKEHSYTAGGNVN
jgi:hypothetical protein